MLGRGHRSLLHAQNPLRLSELPACAVLVDAPSGDKLRDVASLFDAGIKTIRLVERTTVDKVLAEQKLQLLQKTEAGAARIRVGELLKAQSLILLRHWPASAQGEGARESQLRPARKSRSS